MSDLSAAMDFDHVIEVLPDGTWRDAPRGIYAPESPLDPEPYATTLEGGWTLPLSGFSGQDRYTGPWLHDSEVIEGGVERRILETPGYWVAIYAQYTPEDGEDGDDGGETIIEGWTAAYRPGPQYGVARPDGTIVPADPEWDMAGQDGVTLVWSATSAPLEFVWNADTRRWDNLPS